MRMAGWKTREIFNRYDVVSDEDMRVAQERTEEYLKQTEKQVAEVKQISRAIN